MAPETLHLASAREALREARVTAFNIERPPQWWYKGTGWKARLLYGVPHRYRQGDSQERRWLLCTFLAAQLGLGAVVGAIILTSTPRIRAVSWIHMSPLSQVLVLLILAALLAIYLLLVAEVMRRRSRDLRPVPWWARVKPAAFHYLLIFGGINVSAGIFLLPQFLADGAGLYILGVAYAFVFFTHWRALAYHTAAMSTYAMILADNQVGAPFTRALLLWLISAMVGSCFSIVVGREYLYRGYFGGKAEQLQAYEAKEHD